MACRIDRPRSEGVKDVGTGTPVRVDLVAIGGTGDVHGFANLTEGSIHDPAVEGRSALQLARSPRLPGSLSHVDTFPRRLRELYGPTTGDLVPAGRHQAAARDRARLHHLRRRTADRRRQDAARWRGLRAHARPTPSALDMVIQNATIIDAVAGIVKADIGIRDGRIVGIGKAGNPTSCPVSIPDCVVGPNTTVVHADGFIVTAGAIEAHAHFSRRSSASTRSPAARRRWSAWCRARFRRRLLGPNTSGG